MEKIRIDIRYCGGCNPDYDRTGLVAEIKQVLTDPKYDAAWDVYPFNSGYFMCIRLKTVDAETLRKHILDKYGVGLIATGGQNLRVAFSCVDEPQIPELFDTVLQGVKELEGTA